MTDFKHRHLTWKKLHRWLGLPFAIVMLLFCVSGIILNHRALLASCDVARDFLPASYAIKNYNNGVIRGTVAVGSDSVLAFGNCGVWLTNRHFDSTTDFNRGLPEGVDRKNIRNIVRTSGNEIWCGSQYGVYRLEAHRGWSSVDMPGNDERVTDITLTADSSGIIVATRSALYVQGADSIWHKMIVPAPAGKDNRPTLFKTLWNLHSGSLFGLAGRIVVDVVALVLIVVSVTGIALFIAPYRIRHRCRKGLAPGSWIAFLRRNFVWHNQVGYFTIVLTVLVVFTGMCLRPPLMIPGVLIKTAPIPGSSLAGANYWNDKLRALRYDPDTDSWLLSTSEGFYRMARLGSVPEAIPAERAPVVSPMGVNVFLRESPGVWIVGSFSGIYRWMPSQGICFDYFANTQLPKRGRAQFAPGGSLVCGYSSDTPQPTVFDYAKGAPSLPAMDEQLASQPMSLWNFALELHVGRCYSPFLGPFSDLFVFLSGLVLLIVLLSGYVLSARRKHHLKKKTKKQSAI